MRKKLLMFTLCLALLGDAAAADPQTRRIMHDVARALEVLLPLSLDDDALLAQDKRETVTLHLSKLEDAAGTLAKHVDSRSLDFQLSASAFARATTHIRKNINYVHPADARYFLVDLTQHCVACHSLEAADRDFPLSDSLRRYLEEKPLDDREKARLQTALRQFESAMDTWESLLSDPATNAVDMAWEGDFAEYLTIAVRVQSQYSRAARQLQEISEKPDVPFYLKRRIDTWIQDLRTAEQEKNQIPTIQDSRKAFLRPETSPGLSWNDNRLVSDLVLSASLKKLVSSNSTNVDAETMAEAYYMLGVLEARTVGAYSALPSMERFWEAAIRTAPNSPYAVDAYALIEEYAATTFSGALPFEQTDDTFVRLKELRTLIGLE